jgi:hypothetical protein
MRAANNGDPGPVDCVPSTGPRSFPVHGLDPRLQQELTDLFESVMAFADFCTYLTTGRVGGDLAGRLVALAQALYSETTEDLQRGVGRG